MILLDTWFNNPALQKALLPAFIETIQMVGIASLVTVLVGLPLGVILFVTQSGGLGENRPLNFVLSSIVVNITRSIPYAILMVALMPFTKWIVGTSLGPTAASVSLSIAAIPFFARLVETALRDVHPGKLDAAHAMGSTKMQSVVKVLIPERCLRWWRRSPPRWSPSSATPRWRGSSVAAASAGSRTTTASSAIRST